MKHDIDKLINDYYKWLKKETAYEKIDENCYIITSPFLDRHNDHLEIIIEKIKNNEYLLTDDGYTINDLAMSGFEIKTEKQNNILNSTLNGFGIKRHKNELQTIANKSNFASKKHNLLQAMLAINDMFYLSSPSSTNIFINDVLNWFQEKDIIFIPQVSFNGESGLSFVFDIVIPNFKGNPEKIINAVNNPNLENSKARVFNWIDTIKKRPVESKGYVILNDTNKKIPTQVENVYTTYNIQPLVWSQKDKLEATLNLH